MAGQGHAEELGWLKRELGDVKTELKPVGSDARGAMATATALNVQVEVLGQQVFPTFRLPLHSPTSRQRPRTRNF